MVQWQHSTQRCCFTELSKGSILAISDWKSLNLEKHRRESDKWNLPPLLSVRCFPRHTRHTRHVENTALWNAERQRHLRGMIPWLTSSSRVRRCWSFNCSTAGRQRERRDRGSVGHSTTQDTFSNTKKVSEQKGVVLKRDPFNCDCL